MTVIHEDLSVPPLLANPATFVVDPVYADTVEMDRDLVSVAGPTNGPNRYTVHVPSEQTVLSLGQQSPRWTTDKGIVGYTNNHIHFETKTGSQTIVSLGGPATTSSLKGLDDKAPVASNGYAMVTVRNAWQEATLQHAMLSQDEDVTLRAMGHGKRVVLQADKGIVDLNGKVEVNIAGGGVAIGAHKGLEFEPVKYAEPFKGETPHSIAAKRGAQFMAITNAAVTAHNLITGASHAFHSFRHGKIREIARGAPEWGEWLADLGEFALTSLEIHELFSEEEAVEGSIKMDAQKDFGVSAGGSVGFFGIRAASLTSAIWSSVSAVVAASLKGTLFAGVASTYTSLKGYRKIELGSDHGEIAFNAKRDVQISTEASAIAVGKTLAQVSGEQNAYFNGGQVVWVGTTADVGWGLHLSTKGLMIGKANGAGAMATASIDTTRGILIDTQGISVKSGSSSMVLSGTNIVVEAGSIELNGKDDEVRIGAKKVLIDG